jgi:hypothetical protein
MMHPVLDVCSEFVEHNNYASHYFRGIYLGRTRSREETCALGAQVHAMLQHGHLLMECTIVKIAQNNRCHASCCMHALHKMMLLFF